MLLPRLLCGIAALTALCVSVRAEEGAIVFETHVRPILKTHCFHCHGDEPKPKGGLDLRLARAMIRGGKAGAAVEPGDHDASLIWERVAAGEMPPGTNKLSAKEKATIAGWIDQGAKTSRPEPESLPPGPVFTDEERAFWSFQPIKRPEVPVVNASERVRTPIDAFLLQKIEAKGLAFGVQADRHTLIRRLTFDLIGLPPTPEEIAAFFDDKSIDAYEKVVDRLLDSPHYGERSARHWLDLAGYADSDGGAANDAVRPYAYKYRDYLIRSLNADRPWDEMVREQLAGDELVTSARENLSAEDRERLAATGFLRMAPDTTAEPGTDAVLARNDVVAETLKVVSTSLLGLTVGCAQCHTHRYDPITHEDYHRLRAIFEPALDPTKWKTPTQRLISAWTPTERDRASAIEKKVEEINKERRKAFEALVAKVLEKELAQAPADLRSKLREAREVAGAKRSDEQKALLKTYPRVLVNVGNVSLYDGAAHGAIVKEFDAKVAEGQTGRPKDDFIHAMTEPEGTPATTRLFFRGDPHQPRQEVVPGDLSILNASVEATAIALDDPALPTSGRRLAYARHLTSGRHPLLPRVLVNRLWMHHFGRGIVATPSDFGVLGARPTHPELLDWLADDLVRNGWNLKRFHRLIVTSTAYRLASRREPTAERIDPDNRLLTRMSVRRLEAEEIRDAILATCGGLNRTTFGPPSPVALDEAGQVLIGIDTRDAAGRQTGPPGPIGGREFRRTLYVQVRRSLPLSFTEPFDAPTLTPNCERRGNSTSAPQSLTLMNSEFMVMQANLFSERVFKEVGADPAAQVRRAWTLVLGIEPGADQVSKALRFLAVQKADFAATLPAPAEPPPTRIGRPVKRATPAPPGDPAKSALATLGQALLGSNAFLYVD